MTELIDESDGTDEQSSDDADAKADETSVEPVELLVQLAEDGEIDPWDIDIVTVTDRFLDAVESADLRVGGRALFYASVLLRMKSDALTEPEAPEETEELEPWEQAWEERSGSPGANSGPLDDNDPFDTLEREMDRRLERKRVRGVPQTLDELVRELRDREAGTRWKESRTYDTSDSPSGYTRGTQTLDYHSADDLRMDDEPTETDVTGTAHSEDIETVIDAVETRLRAQYDRGRAEVLYAEIAESGGSRVETFLALLFLAHRGVVRLEQDELFEDLWIHATEETKTAPEPN
ncbi:ScpA family protein [Halocatena halophila]|uniref:ScpA family protein n=1 Tax=Halocatena halophila TaxID=2814576 RepID=UPI002ED5D762